MTPEVILSFVCYLSVFTVQIFGIRNSGRLKFIILISWSHMALFPSKGMNLAVAAAGSLTSPESHYRFGLPSKRKRTSQHSWPTLLHAKTCRCFCISISTTFSTTR
jgi:hypothetical protein